MLRLRLSQLIWLVAVLAAMVLAVAALLITLHANPDNALVRLLTDAADVLDLGVFSRDNGIFTFDSGDAAVKNALVNWGLGAIAYLAVGRVLARLIRP